MGRRAKAEEREARQGCWLLREAPESHHAHPPRPAARAGIRVLPHKTGGKGGVLKSQPTCAPHSRPWARQAQRLLSGREGGSHTPRSQAPAARSSLASAASLRRGASRKERRPFFRPLPPPAAAATYLPQRAPPLPPRPCQRRRLRFQPSSPSGADAINMAVGKGGCHVNAQRARPGQGSKGAGRGTLSLPLRGSRKPSSRPAPRRA